jgi:hypothetical protein
VSVLVKEQIWYATDFDGNMQLKPNQILIFTYIGMKTQSLAATSSVLNIKMVVLQ